MQTPGVERMLRTRGRRSVIRVCRLTVRLYPSPGRIGSDDVPVLNPQQHRDISLYGSRPVAGGVSCRCGEASRFANGSPLYSRVP